MRPPVPLLAYIGNRIRDLRTTYGGTGISQEALAQELKVATNTISRWETGVYKPTIEDLDRLARFFHSSILTFFPPVEVPANAEVEALLRAANDLPQTDVIELRRYAEFRRAQYLLRGARPSPGRKRKEQS